MHVLNLEERLRVLSGSFAPVVPFAPGDRLLKMDFTATNTELTDAILNDTAAFSRYVEEKLRQAGALYGIGGYGEHRTIYSRSEIFGPSPNSVLIVQDGAKAPSRWEGDDDVQSQVEEDTVGYRYANPSLYGLLKEFAVKHRSVPTIAEEVLWEGLKTKRLAGFKFRRQHIIDCFIADFVCLKKKVVIEVDGLIHQLPDHQVDDEQRTKRLKELGFDVIRFTNEEVIHSLDRVLQEIEILLLQRDVSLTTIIKNSTTLIKEQPPLLEDSSQSLACAVDGPSHREGSGMGLEPRRLHLGTDIWGSAHTPVFAPLEGVVHSFAFNDNFGDYGATLILQHELEGMIFHSLYGHLSLSSINDKKEGQTIAAGERMAWFGEPEENGHWPPHLHFQLIIDMQGMKGDYPGVCRYSERATYLANCPDPDYILNMMKRAE